MSVAESAQKANKMVSYNQIKTNTYRTIVAGLNQQTISEGTILFVKISIEDNTLTGKQIVKLLNTVLADPEGNSVNCVVLPGEILFSGSESLSEKEDKVSSPSNNEESCTLDFKKVGFIILLSIAIILISGITIRKFMKNKKSNIPSKKQNKKHKK